MAGALALFSGLASAGALPGPLQHAAHVMFDAIGISVPDSSSDSTPGPIDTGPVNASLGPAVGNALPSPGIHGGDGKGQGAGGDGGHVKPAQDPHDGGTPAGHHDLNKPPKGGSGDKPGGSGGSDGSSTDQSGGGPRGLCNAWRHGNKEKRGTAFERLRAEAAAHGQTVEEYCDHVEGNHVDGRNHVDGNGQGGTDGDHKKHHEHHGNSGHHRGGHGGDKHGGKAAEWSPLEPASPVDEAS
jgi:hypothetical protein